MLTFSKNRIPFNSPRVEEKSFEEKSMELIAPPPSPEPISDPESNKIEVPEIKRQESHGFSTRMELHLEPREAAVDCSCGLAFFRRFRSH